MKVYPAIDLIEGNCVRLQKGDFGEKVVYSDSPLKVAKEFEKMGAKYLHVVDLDGAKDGTPRQLDVLSEIAKNTNLKIQTGGGIRLLADVENLLSVGVDRVIVGSLALRDVELTMRIIEKVGAEHITLAFDVRSEEVETPMVNISGWQEKTPVSLWGAIQMYHKDKMPDVLCTDINCDGMLVGPNFDLYKEIKRRYPNIPVQVSGGVSSINDVKNAKLNKMNAIVIGKALYEKRFTLKEALKC